MPQLDQVDTFISQLFWLFASFAVIYYFISKVASPKIVDVIRKRVAKVSSDLEKAEKYKEETEVLNEKFAIEVAKIKSESLKVINQASVEAEELYKEQVARADLDINRDIESSEKEILEVKSQVSAELSKDISGYIEEVLRKLAKVKVDKRIINKMVVKNS